MCARPSMVLPEQEGTGIIEEKANLPAALKIPVIWKPCACGSGFVARVQDGDVWVRATSL